MSAHLLPKARSPKAPPYRGIIEHVSNSEPFLDSKTSYYRFRPEKTRQINVWYPDEKVRACGVCDVRVRVRWCVCV